MHREFYRNELLAGPHASGKPDSYIFQIVCGETEEAFLLRQALELRKQRLHLFCTEWLCSSFGLLKKAGRSFNLPAIFSNLSYLLQLVVFQDEASLRQLRLATTRFRVMSSI